ncbi:ATP-binding cassette domain-containing protein [[Actinomadura] parvosata]|uniref:ATP-binding cassette domain-containing protein n=1 Tax=[Actinomadura] parvosata TaxID=1955412 RepID=UPI00406C65B1
MQSRRSPGAQLDLWAGEAHGPAGENGAGKSTLVKILSVLMRRTRACCWWTGRTAARRSGRCVSRRRHRGDLPGADAVPPPAGGREHLHEPPAVAQPAPHGPGRHA